MNNAIIIISLIFYANFKIAVAQNMNNIEAHFIYGKLKIDEIDSLLEKKPCDQNLSFYKEVLLIDKLDFDSAQSYEMNRVCLRESDQKYLDGLLGLILNQEEKAKRAFEESVKLDPNHFWSLIELSGFMSKSRNWDELIEVSQTLLVSFPDNPLVKYCCAENFYYAGILDSALEVIESIDEKYFPNDVMVMKGKLYLETNQYRKAQKMFESLMDTDLNREARLYLIETLIKANNFQLANSEIEAFVDDNDNDPEIKWLLAFLAFQNGNLQQAEHYSNEYIKENGGGLWNYRNWDCTMINATVLFETGRYESVISLVESHRINNEHHYQLGAFETLSKIKIGADKEEVLIEFSEKYNFEGYEFLEQLAVSYGVNISLDR